MPIVLDASSPSPVFDDTDTLTSLVTASFTPPAGSVVVAKVACADGSTAASLSGSTLALGSSRQNLGTSGGSARVGIWAATSLGLATTITAAFSGTGHRRCLIVSVFTGAALTALSNVASTNGASGAPTQALTATSVGSVMDWINADWSAVDGTSRAYRSSAVETFYKYGSAQYTVYTAYQQVAALGSQTLGLTAPAGQKYTIAGIELRPLQPRVLRGRNQAVNRAANF